MQSSGDGPEEESFAGFYLSVEELIQTLAVAEEPVTINGKTQFKPALYIRTSEGVKKVKNVIVEIDYYDEIEGEPQ